MNIFKKFHRTFWTANAMELFERWAWYGMFLVITLYLTGSKESGALEFSQSQKGWLLGIVNMILYILPLLTGAIADRIGYKKSLMISLIILSTGYSAIVYFTSFHGVFIAFLYLAIGAALFKPIIAATVAKTTDDESSSLGFGIWYMIINIGGFIGPAVASKLREHDWKYVFFGSSIAILINIILLLIFYNEPKIKRSNEKLQLILKRIISDTFHVFQDFRLVIMLIIVVGFWSVYWQLFYTIPNFIDQWVNTSPMYFKLSGISQGLADIIGNNAHGISPEMVVNTGAACIILFQIIVSGYSRKLRPEYGILFGIMINTTGMFFALLTANIWIIFFSLIVSAFGEMMCSPRMTEYFGRIAPEGKTAAYVGSSYLPFALGNFVAGIISGPVYEKMSDKFYFLKKEFILKFPGISVPNSNSGILNEFISKSGLNNDQVNQLLWTKYHPYNLAYIIVLIGIITSIALFLYNRFIVKRS
jgi:dipeptide/tripeptide permease